MREKFGPKKHGKWLSIRRSWQEERKSCRAERARTSCPILPAVSHTFSLRARNQNRQLPRLINWLNRLTKKHTLAIFFHHFYFDVFCRGRVLNASLKGQVINQGVWQIMNIYLGGVVLKNWKKTFQTSLRSCVLQFCVSSESFCSKELI